MFFEDRVHAGWVLGAALAGRVEDAVVLGLSYGGLMVASGVASTLGAPIDAFVASPPGTREPARSARRLPVAGRTVVVVDDGACTGETVRRAVAALRRAGAARLVVALPVAPESVCAHVTPVVDELVCLYRTPETLSPASSYRDAGAVGARVAVRCLAPLSARNRARQLSTYGLPDHGHRR